VEGWLHASAEPDRRRRLSLRVRRPPPDDPEAARGVAAALALPWELCFDTEDEAFLFQLTPRVAVRRQVVGGRRGRPVHKASVLRVLAVVGRPAQAGLIHPAARALLDQLDFDDAVEFLLLLGPSPPQ